MTISTIYAFLVESGRGLAVAVLVAFLLPRLLSLWPHRNDPDDAE